ncbi:hypothetical protein QVD17_27657 [Tagetes erecta]|uniref:Protein kinase domain-containing protein n=1 Tax=Tagetes erecta TaxID=13708 RepID=A0AAD8KDL5_TARER|nr:hypothetical protein QVD17_27657 [Tagetes erecta]
MSVATDDESEPSTSTNICTSTSTRSSSVQWSKLCRHFKFSEILLATQNFDESLVIGRGGFATVYKGNIQNGSTLVTTAIKRLKDMPDQGEPEFRAEVEMLSKLRHFSTKSDVYALGVVLLELLCRKRAVDKYHDFGLATRAQDSIKEGNLKDIVDPRIRDEISGKILKQYARIVERCLNDHPKHRPTMAEVVHSLEYVLVLQEKKNNLLQAKGKTIFGRMIDKFSITNKAQNSGMEYVHTVHVHTVLAKGEKDDPFILERIQTVLRHKEGYVITVVLGARIHCEACAQSIKQDILRMKGVESARVDVESSIIAVKGTFKESELVNYIKKQSKMKVVVLKQDPEHLKEEKKDNVVEKNEEKKVKAAGGVKGKDKENEIKDLDSDEKGGLYLSSGSDESGDDMKSLNPPHVTVKGSTQLVDDVQKQTGKKDAPKPKKYDNKKKKKKEKQDSDNDEEGRLQFCSDSDEDNHLKFHSDSDEDETLQFHSDNDEKRTKGVKLPMNEHNYYHYYNAYYPSSYSMGYSVYGYNPGYTEELTYTPAPQMFSDDNPNACSMM